MTALRDEDLGGLDKQEAPQKSGIANGWEKTTKRAHLASKPVG
jgi:hypothetical protein